MLSPIRLRNSLRFSRHTLLPLNVNPRITSAQSQLYYYYSTDANRSESNRSDRIPTNDPSPPTPVPNVSETNALPSTAWGQGDADLQEAPEAAEHQRQMQAPNRQNVWSRSQERREVAMRGPRFEQTIMELQVSESFLMFTSLRFRVYVVLWGGPVCQSQEEWGKGGLVHVRGNQVMTG
jgi:hypothetical protein